jgi:hypothetical protein
MRALGTLQQLAAHDVYPWTILSIVAKSVNPLARM